MTISWHDKSIMKKTITPIQTHQTYDPGTWTAGFTTVDSFYAAIGKSICAFGYSNFSNGYYLGCYGELGCLGMTIKHAQYIYV